MYSYTSAHTEIQTHICYKHHNLKTITWRELPLVWGYFSVWTTLVLETFDASLNVQIWEPTLISHISFVQTLFKAEALHLFVSSVRTSVFLHSVMFWKRIECYLHTFFSPTYCLLCEEGKSNMTMLWDRQRRPSKTHQSNTFVWERTLSPWLSDISWWARVSLL